MTVRIRTCEPGDLAGLHALDQQCFEPGIAYPRDELEYFVRAKDSITLIAEVNQQLAGFIIAQHYRARAAFQGRIITIDVAGHARRHGVGLALMQAAEAALRERHVAVIRLEVSVENTAAQNFYRRLGYEATGRIERYYLGKTDALTMQKPLG